MLKKKSTLCFRGAGCKYAVMVVKAAVGGFTSETWFQFAFCSVLRETGLSQNMKEMQNIKYALMYT